MPSINGIIKHRLYRLSHLKVVFNDFWGWQHTPASNRKHLRECGNWLIRAHQHAPDNGLARGYYFSRGWDYSHVGCAGDAAETLFRLADYFNDRTLNKTAQVICEWLLENQLTCGAFHRSYVYQKEPRVLNTALAMFGLIEAYHQTSDARFLESAQRGGDWLVSAQEPDGTWRKHNYTFKSNIFTYHTKTAYALTRLYEVTKQVHYLECALRNLDWALTQRHPNGFILNASMNGDRDPQTHLIAYVLRGFAEVGTALGRDDYVNAAAHALRAIAACYFKLGYVPATLNENWGNYNSFYHKHVTVPCLCGDAEFSLVALRLFQYTGDRQYFKFAQMLNSDLKRQHDLSNSDKNLRGGLKGCSKIYSLYYEPFAYTNWAVKFFADALLLEEMIISKVEAHESKGVVTS
ncbi:glycoside hydrolase family 127 protein [bacterium]|nr:glycoside hydrolase family 127 protein [bacterium]